MGVSINRDLHPMVPFPIRSLPTNSPRATSVVLHGVLIVARQSYRGLAVPSPMACRGLPWL